MSNLLNIVDENDEIIGQETREKIHRAGLLHRETVVYFITPQHEIIFQHRAKNKDTFPDLLDATVGGHVEIGQSYEEAAIRETEEETGLKIKPSELIFVSKAQRRANDKVTGMINNAIKCRYLYVFPGDPRSLRVEKGKALGFEVRSLIQLANLSPIEREKFIPNIIELINTEIIETIKSFKI